MPVNIWGMILGKLTARLIDMNSSWKTTNNRRSISHLLIAAVLFSLLLPAHYHLHHLHGADSASHAHAVDLHLITDNTGQSHHDEGTSIFSAIPDVIVKKDYSAFSLFMPLVILLLVLLTQSHQLRIRHDHRDTGLKKHYPYFSPPLRAPPLR